MGSEREKATQSMAIVEKIKPLLAGKGPDVQGAVLVELVATWMAGHPPVMRPMHMGMFLDAVVSMIPACQAEIFAHQTRPEGWT